MRTKIGVMLTMGLGTMLYCSEFLIRRSSRITQEMLFRRVERLLRKTVDLTQKIADLQGVMLEVFPVIANGSLSQEKRKEFVRSITPLERDLVQCHDKLVSFVRFMNKDVVSVSEKNNTK